MFNWKSRQIFTSVVAALALITLTLALLVGQTDQSLAQTKPAGALAEITTSERLTLLQQAGTFSTAQNLPIQEVEAVPLSRAPSPNHNLTPAQATDGQDLLVEKGCVVNPGPGQVNIPPSAFHPAQASPPNEYRFWSEGGFIYSVSGSSIKLIAPVYLPDGVTVTHIAKVFYDNNASGGELTNVVARLIRKSLVNPGPFNQQLGGFYSSTFSQTKVLCAPFPQPNQPLQKIDYPVIDNNYSYYAILEFPANSGLTLNQFEFGLRIYYTPNLTDTTGVETVPIGAFRPNGDNAEAVLIDYEDNGFIQTIGSLTSTLMAPLHPTPGVTLTQMAISVRDVVTENLVVKLQRVKPRTGAVNTIAQISTAGLGDIGAGQLILNITPNGNLQKVSPDYNYFMTVTLPPSTSFGLLFFGGRVSYDEPSIADADEVTANDITIVKAAPAASFSPASNTASSDDPIAHNANSWIFEAAGFLTSDSPTERTCLAAPVYLPAETTIQRLTAYVVDSSSSQNATIYLDRTGLLADWVELASVSSAGNTANIQTLTDSSIAENELPVTGDFHYQVYFCLPANSGGAIKFYGAEVEVIQPSANTTVTVYLPFLNKPEPLPPTNLLVTNLTGGPIDYAIFDVPGGSIYCNIANDQVNQFCDRTFEPGIYTYLAHARCGTKRQERIYKPSIDLLTPFRCN